MKVYINLEDFGLIRAAGVPQPVTSIRFKRGRADPLEVRFASEEGVSVYQEIGDMFFVLKKRGEYDSQALVKSFGWTLAQPEDEDPVYRCNPVMDTPALNALFAIDGDESNDVESVTLMGEISWLDGDGRLYGSKTFEVVVDNDVLRDVDLPLVFMAADVGTDTAIEATLLADPNLGASIDSETSLTADLEHGAVSTLLDDLVAYYAANEGSGSTLGDASGNGLDLTFEGFSEHGWTTGLAGQALELAPWSQAGVTNAALDLTGGFTVSFWIRDFNVSSGNIPLQIGYEGSGYGIAIVAQGGLGVAISLFTAAGEQSNGGSEPAVPVTAGWHHIVVTRDGATGACAIWIDGASAWSDTLDDGSILYDGHPTLVQGMDSDLDEIGIWNRPLTPAEIAELYNAGAGSVYPF